MLRLRTFGGLSIERSAEDGGGSPTSTATAARRRLAFLAVLAASGPRGVPRDKLLALFWPESDNDKARHALDQTIYSLKRDLGAESLVLGREELSINPAAMTSDVEDFQAALARGDRAAAVELYNGPFLDGVFISGAAGFERWADDERARLTRDVEQALETLAAEAANRGDHSAAVQRWQRLATMEPRKTRVVLSLMSELAAAGDRAAALKHAEIYHTLIRDDLDAEPNPAVAALADRLRREPAVVKSPRRTLDRVTATPAAEPSKAEPAPAAVSQSAAEPPIALPAPAAPRRATVEWLRARTTRAYRVAGVAVALVLLLTLSLAWMLSGKRHADAERAWILPADVEDHTEDSTFGSAIDAALAAGLQQSPHVTIFPRSRVQQTLTRMRRVPGRGSARLDETLAREVAQREGVHTVLATSVDRIDSSYVLSARLVEAATGTTIAAESRRASRRSEVIDAVDDLVRRLRHDIGESADAIAKHDLPLPQATTGSLEALRKYADGKVAWAAGQHTPARELYLEAVALDSDFALAHAALGFYYYWNNDRPQGDAHFDHALRLLDRLTDRERLQVRASAESWRGNRDAAIQLRKALLAMYPNDPTAWGSIGYDYMRLHRPNEAIAAYRKQLEHDSLDPSNYINIAVAYRQLDRHDEAVRYYQRAFALQPSLLRLENVNHEYGIALIFSGKPEAARAVYDSMLTGDVDQRARGHRSLGMLAMIRGRYGEAIDRFRDAVLLSQGPDRALTEARNRLFLALAEQEKGWRDSASAQIRTTHALFRRSYFEPMFLWFLGKALARDGQLALASEVLDTLRKRGRVDNPQDRANVLALGGEVALAQGRADSATRLLQLAYTIDSSSLVKESLATAVARGGNLTAAARLYESLLAKAEPWYGWEAEQYALSAPLAAGALYEKANDLPHARAAYEQVLTRWAQGDTDLVTVRASRVALERLQRKSGTLTPGSR